MVSDSVAKICASQKNNRTSLRKRTPLKSPRSSITGEANHSEIPACCPKEKCPNPLSCSSASKQQGIARRILTACFVFFSWKWQDYQQLRIAKCIPQNKQAAFATWQGTYQNGGDTNQICARISADNGNQQGVFQYKSLRLGEFSWKLGMLGCTPICFIPSDLVAAKTFLLRCKG